MPLGTSTAEDFLYNVEVCHIMIDGRTFPVSGFTLTLAHNGIPALRVTIDPMHEHGDPPEPAVKAAVALFVTRYNELQAITEDEDRRKTNFTFSARNQIGDEQSLYLTDWLLVGAGFGGVSASGALQLSLEVAHPLHGINESTVNFMGFKDTKPEGTSTIGANDLYDGIREALEYYKLVADNAVVRELRDNTDFRFMRERFDKMLQRYKDHLQWSNSSAKGWPDKPFESTTLMPYVKFGIWQYVWGVDNTTLWDWLVHTICGQYCVGIRPNYWDTKLELAPFEPWAEPIVTLFDTDIADFSLPPADPLPVCGVYSFLAADQISAYTVMQDKTALGKLLADAALWVEDALPGAIRPFQAPSWAAALLHRAGAENGQQSFPDNPRFDLPANALTSYTGIGATSTKSLEELRSATTLFCQEAFAEEFRRMFQIAVTCRLLLNTKSSPLDGANGRVTPGYVFQLRSGTPDSSEVGTGGGPALLKFFATQIVHTVDCTSKTARTEIIGSYLRRSDGPNLRAITAGVAHNVLYN